MVVFWRRKLGCAEPRCKGRYSQRRKTTARHATALHNRERRAMLKTGLPSSFSWKGLVCKFRRRTSKRFLLDRRWRLGGLAEFFHSAARRRKSLKVVDTPRQPSTPCSWRGIRETPRAVFPDATLAKPSLTRTSGQMSKGVRKNIFIYVFPRIYNVKCSTKTTKVV